jgi:hypothetical protein
MNYELNEQGKWFEVTKQPIETDMQAILRKHASLVPPIVCPMMAPETLMVIPTPLNPSAQMVMVTRIHQIPFRTSWTVNKDLNLVPCWTSHDAAIDPGRPLYWTPPKEFKVLFCMPISIYDSHPPSWVPDGFVDGFIDAFPPEALASVPLFNRWMSFNSESPVLVYQDQTGYTSAAILPNVYRTGLICMGSSTAGADYRKAMIEILKDRPNGIVTMMDYLNAIIQVWAHSRWNKDLLSNAEWLERLIQFDSKTFEQIPPDAEAAASWKMYSIQFSQEPYNIALKEYHKVWGGLE